MSHLSSHFYQGGWELDEDIELAAARETLEEAGVIGLLGVSFYYQLHSRTIS